MPEQKSRSWQQAYVEHYYRSRPGWIDGTVEFWQLIRKYLSAPGNVLELGCGPTNRTSEFLSSIADRLEGLDVDEGARNNEHIDQVHIYDGGAWPLEDASLDGVVADYVLEHVEHPSAVVAEVARVLKPGGVFLFRAPNVWHYVSMLSYLTPQWLHRLASNRLRNAPSEARDPYPTYYRMNTRRSIRSLCRKASLEELELRMIEKEPSYGMSSRILFHVFMLYERMVNKTGLLAGARANVLGAYRNGEHVLSGG